MPIIQAVLFDLDDTLWPILPVIERAERKMHDWLQQHAPVVAWQFSIEALRQRRQELMTTDPVYQLDLNALRRAGLMEAFEHTGGDPSLVDHAMQIFCNARNEVEFFEDVLPSLSRLRRKFRLGSISNGMSDLNRIGLADVFEVSIAAHQTGCCKPDARIFRQACEMLSVAPEQAVYVGDDPHLDVLGAQRAGLRAVWLKRPELTTKPLPDDITPDAICTSLDDLHFWLEYERAMSERQ